MVILLTSPSALLLREKIAEIVALYQKKAGSQAPVIRHTCERETSFADLRRELGTASLFATKQLVILRSAINALTSAQAGELLAYLKEGHLPTTTSLMLTEIEPLPVATKNPLLAYLKKSRLVKKISVAAPIGLAAQKDLITRAKILGATLAPTVAQQLESCLGADYDRKINELTKLALFAAARPGQTITLQDVNNTVQATLESDIFKTISAFGQRQLQPALQLLHRHLQQGAHPLYLLSMLRYQFRSLVALQAAQGDAGRAGLSPFVARKTLRDLKNFAGRDLPAIYSKLVDADEAIKTSRVDGDVALDLLAVAICR